MRFKVFSIDNSILTKVLVCWRFRFVSTFQPWTNYGKNRKVFHKGIMLRELFVCTNQWQQSVGQENEEGVFSSLILLQSLEQLWQQYPSISVLHASRLRELLGPWLIHCPYKLYHPNDKPASWCTPFSPAYSIPYSNQWAVKSNIISLIAWAKQIIKVCIY